MHEGKRGEGEENGKRERGRQESYLAGRGNMRINYTILSEGQPENVHCSSVYTKR